jgi:hypothetical protein
LRASFDDAARSPRGAITGDAGALDSLTLDIARMATTPPWRVSRYQRGEKGGLSVAVSTYAAIRPSRKFVAAIASIRHFARPPIATSALRGSAR